MITIKKLKELGFERVTYKEEDGKPSFYRIKKLTKEGEVIVEIREDLKYAQWCIDALDGDYQSYVLPETYEKFVKDIKETFGIIL